MTPVVACAPCVCGSLRSQFARHGRWVATLCAGCTAAVTCISVADYLDSDDRRPDPHARRRARPPVAEAARRPRRKGRARRGQGRPA